MEGDLPRFELNSVPIRSFSIRSTKTLPKTDFDSSKLPRYEDFELLGRFLRKCMRDQAGSSTNGGEGFLPPALLNIVLPRETIQQGLKKEGCYLDPAKTTNIILGGVEEDDDESAEFDKRYLVVLAILALLGKVSEIGHFVHGNDGGIRDGDLPLQLHNGSDGSLELRHRSKSQLIRCFEKWTDNDHLLFNNFQWRLLVPTFVFNDDNTIRHQILEDETVLPWCEEQLQSQGEAMSGGFGSVKKVKIHPLCHEYHERLKAINVSGGIFAVKTLKHADATKFQSEVNMLKKFNGLVHDHLVTLLGTYTHKKQFNMIFPSAECDIEDYWEKRNPTPNSDDIDFMRWVSSQCRGIMEAVNVIHNPPHLVKDKVFGRHGDIKPENILWFKSPNEAGRGIWVISDLGLSAFNREQSRSMIPNQSITWTPAYRPPECDIDGGTISRAFDIWTLGCFYLEMVCWLLGGWRLKDEFHEKRTTIYVTGTGSDIFFDLQLNGEDETNETYIALVKPQVAEGIDNLHNHPNCTDYIHNLLDIIEKDMLVVLSTDQGRERSPVLLNKLTSMHQNCINDANYCSEKTPRRRLFRAPTGTIARLGSEAKGMVNKNNMRNKLTPNILQPGKSYHRSLRKEDLENVDGFAWPRES